MLDTYILPDKEELIHYPSAVDGKIELLVLTSGEELVLGLEPIPEILEIGIQGPPGIQGTVGPQGIQGVQGVQGAQGTATTYPYPCAEPISAHRVVRLNQAGQLEYASCDNLSHKNSILGISVTAGNVSEITNVARVDTLIEPTWSWVPNEPLYLGINGFITQTPPTSLFLLSVGVALSPTKIFINIGIPIILS
jgi:hypothetical protein